MVRLPGAARRVFTYRRCDECGMMVCDPMLSMGELAEYYAGIYYGRGGVKFPRCLGRILDRVSLGRADWVASRRSAGRILDIGCGEGRFLRMMRKRGWEVHGTELDGPARDRAAQIAGCTMHRADPEQWEVPDNYFDVITLWHVLEHSPDPAGLLDACRRRLGGDGLLVIEVPNLASFQARLCGVWWFHLDPPRHLYQFTPRALAALLRASGFRVIRMEALDGVMGAFGAAQSILNLAIRPRECLYDMLRARGRAGCSWPAVLGSVVFFPLALAVGVLLSSMETALGHGAMLRAAAVRDDASGAGDMSEERAGHTG